MRIGMVAVFLVGSMVGRVHAHHGWGSYDRGREIEVDAVIEEASLANPHSTMRVEHEGESWVVVLAPLSRMQARGATREVVTPGRRVTAFAYPRKDGSREMRAEWIEIEGKRYPLKR